MKKQFILTGLVFGSLFLAGCKAKTPETSTPTTTQTATSEGGSLTDNMKSWADAVKIGGGLRCTFTNTKTNQTSNYVAKGKKMRMSGYVMSNDPSLPTGEMLSDANYMYIWDPVKKEGFKMALPSEEEIAAAADKANETVKDTPDFTSEDGIREMEEKGYTMDCSPGVISDSEFVPPTDVKFQDYSSLVQDAMKKAQEGMTDDEKKKVEEMMKQYGN